MIHALLQHAVTIRPADWHWPCLVRPLLALIGK